MSDPTAGQPTQEEMRAYLDQLREADAAGLVAEAFNLLATGAQVKLGRPDARMLIDALAAIVEATTSALPQQIADQMSQGVGQLQMAQVQAERDAAAAPDAGQAEQAEDSQQAEGTSTGAPGGPPGGNQKMTDRLWIPGRDPQPPSR